MFWGADDVRPQFVDSGATDDFDLMGVAVDTRGRDAAAGVLRGEPAARVVFYMTMLGTLLSAAPLPFAWQTPTLQQWLLLGLLGVAGTGAQLALTRAYACAPAAHIGPFTYTAVLFAGLYGWLFWAEVPDGLSLAGAIVVCVAGVWTLRLGGTATAKP